MVDIEGTVQLRSNDSDNKLEIAKNETGAISTEPENHHKMTILRQEKVEKIMNIEKKIISIIVLILVLKNRMVKAATSASAYLVNGSVVINKRSDRFITTHTTSVRIDTSSSSGGSSTHRSSSGRSHGGGGRRL